MGLGGKVGESLRAILIVVKINAVWEAEMKM